MAKLRNIVYLTEAQRITLFNDLTITVGEQTVTYSDDDIYIVQQQWNVDGSASDYIYFKDSTGTTRMTISNSGTITAAAFAGSGGALTNLNATNIISGTIDKARLPTLVASDVSARADTWVPSWSDVTSKPTTFAPIIGTGATDAAAGNHTHAYEPTITAGTTSQYWRGDKSWQTLNATAVGLGNVTNNAQVKKSASSTSGKVPTWNGTTGDALNDGYTVQTSISSSTTALVRADAIVTALSGKSDTLHNHSGVYEPVITKLTAFNKNYGTTATDVKMNGTQGVGSVDAIARIDHVHPVDTSRAPLASPTFTGTVGGITATMVGLGNVTNESKATMFTSPTFTGTTSGITATMVGLGNVANTAQVTAVSGAGAIASSGGTTPQISHSTADGYLHAPATGTSNNGKVLTAGATAGTISWAAAPVTSVNSATGAVTFNYAGSAGVGGAADSVATSVTFNNGGSGAASGTTFNGSVARTISYNTIGAAASSHTQAVSTISDATTIGQNLVKLTNPSAVTFLRVDATNTVTARSAANFKTDLSLNNVTNESKATMFTSAALTSTPTAPTAAAGTNTTQIASTAFVNAEIDYHNAYQIGTTVSTSSLTPTTAYRNKFCQCTYAGTTTINTTRNVFNVGDEISFVQISSSSYTVQFAQAANTFLYSTGAKRKIDTQYCVATMKLYARDATYDYWILFGALKS